MTMINLLPSEQKQLLWRDYHRRVLVVGGFLFSCLLFVAIVVLATLYFSVGASQQRAENTLIKGRVENTVATADQLEQEIKSFSQKLALLNGSGIPTPITAVIKSILNHKIAGVVLNTINYNKNLDELVNINVAGTAQTRSQFLALVEALRSDPTFKKVDSPVSNLIKESQTDFSLSLEINNE